MEDKTWIIKYISGDSANAELWYSSDGIVWYGLAFNNRSVAGKYVLFYTQNGGEPRAKDVWNKQLYKYKYEHIPVSEALKCIDEVADHVTRYWYQFVWFFARELMYRYNVNDDKLAKMAKEFGY